jgi:sulfonate transport system substrate-binding protein
MSRRHFTSLFAILFLACSRITPSAAPGSPQTGAERIVRIGYQRIGAPFLLKERSSALDQSLAAQHARAEWVEFQSGPPVLEAMRAGAVDIGYVGETPPVFAQAGGVPFVYVASDAPAPKSEAILVPRDSSIHSLAELKGKRVGLNRGSNVHYLLLRALEKAGLALADLQVTYLAPPDARAAFDSGQLDAWVIWDPFQAGAELDGARVLQDGSGLVENRFYYVARREFAQTQAPLLQIALDAFKTLSAWAKTHPEESARLLAGSSGIKYEALLRAERRHTYELEPITPEILQKQQTIADAFRAQQLIPNDIQLQDAFLAVAGYRSGS